MKPKTALKETLYLDTLAVNLNASMAEHVPAGR